ncbi:hypothetical protein [Zunongwangia pacifica]|uniref:Uncharacterized protein n=1 Tax=Zunongwangia pacifica TaxID=2911062 RepID=A0A9X1ZS84_9FLAO|nr:hypothetical protein [Zunongwangia pacifica]MCL6220072.1 hypothetical protein [Zunongwangia pacifica]
MKNLLSILFLFTLSTGLFAQEIPAAKTVHLQLDPDKFLAPVLTDLKPNQFLVYDPNLPSGRFIGVQNEREEFDMVGVIREENRQRELAKAKRLASINLPQTAPREEKAIQLTGNNQQDQLNNGINNFNNNNFSSNPFHRYHNSLYNSQMNNFYTTPYPYRRSNRYYY